MHANKREEKISRKGAKGEGGEVIDDT